MHKNICIKHVSILLNKQKHDISNSMNWFFNVLSTNHMVCTSGLKRSMHSWNYTIAFIVTYILTLQHKTRYHRDSNSSYSSYTRIWSTFSILLTSFIIIMKICVFAIYELLESLQYIIMPSKLAHNMLWKSVVDPPLDLSCLLGLGLQALFLGRLSWVLPWLFLFQSILEINIYTFQCILVK